MAIKQSFWFKTKTVQGRALTMTVRLAWYGHRRAVLLGEQWRLRVKLKHIHGYANPGGFDYAAYALERNLAASGYVRHSQLNRRLAASGWHQWVARLRQTLAIHLDHLVSNKKYLPMIKALVIGDKSGLSAAQWQVLQRTGTNHLMVIAGLHVGMLSGLIFFLVQLCWRCSRRLTLYITAKQAGAIAALLTALTYSALAGFSIPTVRATAMLSVFMFAIIFKRQLSIGLGLAYAVFLVLLLFPLATLSVGFWLSFAAVTVIFYGMGARLAAQGVWWKWGRLQWVVSVGLIPLTLFWFQNASFVAPLANSLVIPLVGFIVVPLSLLGSLLSFFWLSASHALLQAAVFVLKIVWWLLHFFSQLPLASWQHGVTSIWSLLAALLGMFLLLAPRAWPAKWLAIILLLPLWLGHPSRPAYGEVKFTLLDVGQGLASVVQTQHHVLVFDTGAKYSADFDLGQAVVVPFLRHEGIQQLSMLVISHGDNDHIGGAQSVLAAFPTKTIMTSVPARFKRAAQLCLAGRHWQWDGVTFRFLYPDKAHLGEDNNSSCVLRISAGQQHLLLTGDIERQAEAVLLKQQRSLLSATVIVAPHHGSKTSSTRAFLQAVQPQWVLFPVGYLNKFHFPNQSVLQRYQALGVQAMRTDSGGAITVWLRPNKAVKPRAYRFSERRFWRQT